MPRASATWYALTPRTEAMTASVPSVAASTPSATFSDSGPSASTSRAMKAIGLRPDSSQDTPSSDPSRTAGS